VNARPERLDIEDLTTVEIPPELEGDVLSWLGERRQADRDRLVVIVDRIEAAGELALIAGQIRDAHGGLVTADTLFPYGLDELEAARRRSLVLRVTQDTKGDT
jgi:hypothetical protein